MTETAKKPVDAEKQQAMERAIEAIIREGLEILSKHGDVLAEFYRDGDPDTWVFKTLEAFAFLQIDTLALAFESTLKPGAPAGIVKPIIMCAITQATLRWSSQPDKPDGVTVQ